MGETCKYVLVSETDNNVQCYSSGLAGISLVDTNADKNGDQRPDGALFVLSTGFAFPLRTDTAPFIEGMNYLHASQSYMETMNKKWAYAGDCTPPKSSTSGSRVQLFARDIFGAFFLYAVFTLFVIVVSVCKYLIVKYNLDKVYFPHWQVDIVVLEEDDKVISRKLHQDVDSDDDSEYIKSLESFQLNRPPSVGGGFIDRQDSLNEVIQNQISQEMLSMTRDLRMVIKKEVRLRRVYCYNIY